MTDLSPAAKAAMDAVHAHDAEPYPVIIAAALSALANYRHQPGSGISHWWPDERTRQELRNIADELSND